MQLKRRQHEQGQGSVQAEQVFCQTRTLHRSRDFYKHAQLAEMCSRKMLQISTRFFVWIEGPYNSDFTLEMLHNCNT